MAPDPARSVRPPLFVDLDGTLLRTDMLLETTVALLGKNPLYLALLPVWLLRGRAALKGEIARRVDIEPEGLPYHPEFLEFLREEHRAGRDLVLATASHRLVAEPIAKHLGIFRQVIATEAENLKGKRKLAAIQASVQGGAFGYAGNGPEDRPLWAVATERIVVGKSTSGDFTRAFPSHRGALTGLIKALRVHQWVKNLLVFVPLIMAHRMLELDLLRNVLLAFWSFSLCASTVYVLNDMLDLSADRQHPKKRLRPFASGAISLSSGLLLIPLLLLLAALCAATLPPLFTQILLGYFLLTTAYSVFLKQVVLVDILVLAALYTVRLMAGGAAVGVAVSQWLLAFSMFFFLSLACVKRYSELLLMQSMKREGSKGRGYLVVDREQVAHLGTSAGYISVLVLALYINSREVFSLYTKPELLWFICPVLLYWVSRVWMIAHRGNLHEDPIVFALRDKVSYLVGAMCAACIMLAV